MAKRRRRHGFGDFTENEHIDSDTPKLFSAASSPHIEFTDNRQVVVEGCKCIAEYNDSSIKLNTGNKFLRFTGRCLTIKTMQPEQLIICGEIISMDFSSLNLD